MKLALGVSLLLLLVLETGCGFLGAPTPEVLKGRVETEDGRSDVACSIRLFAEGEDSMALAEIKTTVGKTFEEPVHWVVDQESPARHLEKYIVLFDCAGYTPQLRSFDETTYGRGPKVIVDLGTVRVPALSHAPPDGRSSTGTKPQ